MKLIEKITLDDIYDFMETGNPDDAPAEIVYYLDLLSRVHGMILRIDNYGSKQKIIKHLIVADGLTHYKANQLYAEAIEYFYADKEINKKSWASFYADIIDQEINFCRQIKTSSYDSQRIVRMARVAAELRGVFEADKQEIPEELFQKPIVIYTTKAEEIGMAKVDRNRLKEFIDKKIPDLTEKEKQRLYQEADIIPFETFPHEQKDPRKA